jgi:hypothetical protein
MVPGAIRKKSLPRPLKFASYVTDSATGDEKMGGDGSARLEEIAAAGGCGRLFHGLNLEWLAVLARKCTAESFQVVCAGNASSLNNSSWSDPLREAPFSECVL